MKFSLKENSLTSFYCLLFISALSFAVSPLIFQRFGRKPGQRAVAFQGEIISRTGSTSPSDSQLLAYREKLWTVADDSNNFGIVGKNFQLVADPQPTNAIARARIYSSINSENFA